MAEDTMMNTTTTDQASGVRGALEAAPDVTITRLPFGGAVLVNGRTLALLECAEPDAELLEALLTAPANRRGWTDRTDAVLGRMATRLVDDGWLVPAAKGGDER
jgi:hypothetical protein